MPPKILKMNRPKNKPKQKLVRPQLTDREIAYVEALIAKYPEMDVTTMVRRAVRELAEREQVA